MRAPTSGRRHTCAPPLPPLRYQLPDALMKGGGTGTTLRAGSAGAQRNYGAQPAAGISYSAIS